MARLRGLAGCLLLWLAGHGGAALAQFATLPGSALHAPPAPSAAADDNSYRKDAARHVYASYPAKVHKGKLPAMMYAVMITDTEIDASGLVQAVKVVRPPAAASEVTPWVVGLIQRASPFPPPVGLAGPGKAAVYREIWLVDKTGRFQVDSLTEGQH